MTFRAITSTAVDAAALLTLGKPGGPIYLKWLQLLAKIDATAKRKLSNDMVHVITGNLRSSQEMPFVAFAGSTIVGTSQNIAKYALAVHNGSRPHDIYPNAKSVLTGWTFQGAPVFTPVVHHPGTKGRPWLSDSLREVMASQL